MEFQDKTTLFFVLLALSLILTRLPYIGIFFRVLNTLVHESGHALMALLTSARIIKVELFQNTAGSAVTQAKSKWSQFLISLAGYPSASATGFLFFYLVRTDRFLPILMILLVISLLNLVFFVRNLYGIFWLVVFSALLVLLILYRTPFLLFSSTVFFAWIILIDSLAGSLQLLYLSVKNPGDAGDAKNLKKMTGIPAFFWALVFTLQALYFVYLTLVMYYPALSIY